ncbi:MAG: DinB family protein [Vicinamibacterales bacterium]
MVATFDLDHCVAVLERTPQVVRELLAGLPAGWTHTNEGAGTWSPYDVVGHLIHGEKTDWIPRLEIIVGPGADKRFTAFDRGAQFQARGDRSLEDLIEEFGECRRASLERLRAHRPTGADLDRPGIHPEFGPVTLRQLLATWVVHDLDHVVQITRVMAKQLSGEVGPWIAYLGVLRDRT